MDDSKYYHDTRRAGIVTFINRAKRAGAFGKSDPRGVTYFVSKVGVGLGFQLSPAHRIPCLLGLYSEAKAGQFRGGLRWCLRRLLKEFSKAKYEQALISIDYDGKDFLKLFRFYETVFGCKVVGEHVHGAVMAVDVKRLETF